MRVTASLVIACLACAGRIAACQDNAAMDPAAVDLRCQFPAGAAIVCALTLEASGSLTLQRRDVTETAPMSFSRADRFVDECISVDAATHASVQTRTWLEARHTRDGEPDDPPWQGITATYSNDAKQSKLTIGDRLLPNHELASMSRNWAFVGAFLEFPDAVVVDSRFAIEPRGAAALMQTLFGSTLEPRIEAAWWNLDQVDDEANVAYLTGHVVFHESGPSITGDVSMESGFTVELRAEHDLANHRLTRLTFDGFSTTSGTTPDGGAASGSMEFEGVLTMKPVADPAALRAVVAKFRTTKWEFPESGFSVDLPAYWSRKQGGKPRALAQFLDSRNKDEVNFEIFEMADDRDPETAAYLHWFTQEIGRSGSRKTTISTSTTPLGKAITFLAELENDRRAAGVTTSAGPARKLTFQIVGPTTFMGACEQDMETVIESLKPLK